MNYEKIRSYLQKKMILIPKGTEIMRDYRDDEKWISFNSRMSNPGRRGSAQEVAWTADLDAFYLLETPVAEGLYATVLGLPFLETNRENPVTNVSWYDSIQFCNKLSIEMGFEPCYSFSENRENITWNKGQEWL
ncbi:formylglycine-generating enzyme family protein [endosymbiont 'TC1' of Trimyema compressum]|uniref:formylglycine-generating enzyme family protein n=1 Tax=endosymbiont 'TC1' of Trimyema compressum TaxID=243899 RepID=UPI001FE14BE5|nr:formylglycine-generating enzyme family protein [endosymbiont 'TC1' of Trimyema compressum]